MIKETLIFTHTGQSLVFCGRLIIKHKVKDYQIILNLEYYPHLICCEVNASSYDNDDEWT